MRYRYDIRCDRCAKFIPHKQLDKNGGASTVFIPDSDVSYEEFLWRCKPCTDQYGIVESYQFPQVKNGVKY